MNHLKNKTCYLCGPICAVTDKESSSWRESIKPELLKYGVNVLDPLKKNESDLGENEEDRKKFRDLILQEKWAEHKKLFWPIARWDLRAVEKSDFLIFNYDASVPTIGTYHEIVMASQQKKPILVKYDIKQLDKFNFWLPILIKAENFFPTWDSIHQELEKVNNGLNPSSHWI